MNLDPALERRAEVEEFVRKHRIGVLTLLFTDIVNATRLKEDLGDREGIALMQRHDVKVRELLRHFREAEEIGKPGDSFFIVFAKPSDAVKFSLRLQAELRALAKETGRPVLDRIGINVGEVFIDDREGSARPKDLYGIQVDICHRVMSLAEAGQILMAQHAFDSARPVLKGEDIEGLGELSWLNHGPYMLKGVEEPLEICEVGEAGRAPLKAPTRSDKAHRALSSEQEPVLGWRPAVRQPVPNTEWVLEQCLGEGGFGEVWLGCNYRLEEQRVFKFCFRADRVRSLKRELTLFALLRERVGEHPNLITVKDVYLEKSPYYLVMDYVSGRDLRIWCEKHGGAANVPLSTRLEIVAQVADGLEAAHRAGVLHRDVKPSNILIEEVAGSLRAKLTDFGIGQVVSEEILKSRPGFTQTMFGSGLSLQSGTLMYMAPELRAGQAASSRSDLYSLGVVLFQLIVGDFLQPEASDWDKQVKDPLLVGDLRRCFSGNPKERFESAAELAAHLRSLDRRRALSESETSTGGVLVRDINLTRLQILDFELLHEIGVGSYGRVWLARNVVGTYRAIKTVSRERFENDAPYEREFSAIRKFEQVTETHQGLLRIFHIGRYDQLGYFYYVMELADDEVSGQQINPDRYRPKTLSSEIWRLGKLQLEDCVGMGLLLTAVLQHLHEQGLLHGDVKTSNVIFVKGVPKLADIGLVKRIGELGDGDFVGTPGFLAPEGPVAPASDVYGLGKVLYQASTGNKLDDFPQMPTGWQGSNAAKYWAEFSRILLRACESNARDRYQSAQLMYDDLQRLQPSKPGINLWDSISRFWKS